MFVCDWVSLMRERFLQRHYSQAATAWPHSARFRKDSPASSNLRQHDRRYPYSFSDFDTKPGALLLIGILATVCDKRMAHRLHFGEILGRRRGVPAEVAQASCLWGRWASRLPVTIYRHQAGCLVSPQTRCLCYSLRAHQGALSPWPECAFTIATSVVLMMPLALTSVRKLLLLTGWPT
jgi:hypothetical protein